MLGQTLAPAAIVVALLTSPANASRCIGSSDPVVERMELATGRNPAAAVDLIDKAIANTDPANRRRLAGLYVAKSQALYMSGSPYEAPLTKARSIAGPFGATDNLGLYLRITEAGKKVDPGEMAKALTSIVPDYEALPDGSPAKTCRGADLAFFNFAIRRTLEAMTFATQAYRNADRDPNSIERAQAASTLAYIVMAGRDFAYSNELHSEAYAIQRKLGLSDLAANQLLVRGYSYLERKLAEKAVKDFEDSVREARSYGNQYAVHYAQMGLCHANLERNMPDQAAPACEAAYEGLTKPGEQMDFTATTLMARLEVERGNPARALQLLDPVIEATNGGAPSLLWIMAQETRAQALFLTDRDDEAYVALREANAQSKEFHDRELQAGVAALQARFQTEELQKRLAAEEMASNARLRLVIAVVGGSVAILALLGALIFILLRHRRKFHRLAMTDPLTGLANRRATLAKAKEALRGLGQAKPRASIALIDLDHFKSCNDRFGHNAGDLVLSEFARIMAGCVRPDDIVGRWGGEEFIAVFPATNAQEAANIVDRIRAFAARERFAFSPDYRLEFSAGIAMLDDMDEVDACITLADKRLYAAKEQGRDRTCLEGAEGEA